MTLANRSDAERLLLALEAEIPRNSPPIARLLKRKLYTIELLVKAEQLRKGPHAFRPAKRDNPTHSQPPPHRLSLHSEHQRATRRPQRRTPWSRAFSIKKGVRRADGSTARADLQPPSGEAWHELLGCPRCRWATHSETQMTCPQGHGLEVVQARRRDGMWEVR